MPPARPWWPCAPRSARRRRPGRRRHRAGHRAALPRPRAARGGARSGEDAAGAHPRRGARPGHQAGAVHPGPDAGRRHRLAGVRRAQPASSSSARARSSPTCCSPTRSTGRRRRRRPSLLEAMEERQVSVDGHPAPAARPVHRRRHPEPGRVRGHLPAAGGPARPLPAEARRPAARAGTRRSRCCRATPPGSTRATSPRPGSRPVAGRRRSRRGAAPLSAPVTVADEVIGYVVDLVPRDPAVALPASWASPPAGATALLDDGQGVGLAVRPRLRHARRRQGAGPAGAAPPGPAAAGGRARGRHRRRGAGHGARHRPDPR